MGKIIRLKFGDIIINHHASEDNPLKRGIFVKYHKRTIELTNGKGEFWKTSNDKESKLEKIGNMLGALQQRAERRKGKIKAAGGVAEIEERKSRTD